MVIVDDNTELANSICAYLEKESEFQIMGVASDGISGLNLIKDVQPDIALIDIMLPLKDGIGILEDLGEIARKSENFKCPICIMLTAVNHESMTKKSMELGAEYIILKPFDLELLKRRIYQIFEYKDQNSDIKYFIGDSKLKSKEEFVTETLQKVGIPFNLKGYHYLKSAINMSILDSKLLESITKLLYPAVAKECNTTPSRVERDIRHSIEVAWTKGFGQTYYDIIGYRSINNEKPTNSAFIACVVEKSKAFKA